MRHPLAQVPFLLHLDVSKLVLYLLSHPAPQGSQPLCLSLVASLPFLEPPPPDSPCLSAGLRVQRFHEGKGAATQAQRVHWE